MDNPHNRPTREEIAAAYRQVFSSPAGKLVLQDLEDSFCGNTFDKDTNVSMYKQGQRSVPMAIKTMIEVNPNVRR